MSDIFEQTIKEVNAIVNDSERCANDIFEASESIIEQISETYDSGQSTVYNREAAISIQNQKLDAIFKRKKDIVTFKGSEMTS